MTLAETIALRSRDETARRKAAEAAALERLRAWRARVSAERETTQRRGFARRAVGFRAWLTAASTDDEQETR